MNELTPDIKTATVLRHGVLRLTFADGLTGEVDLLDQFDGPVFERARTPEGFAEIYVDEESGTIAWPGGADFAPDTLYERIRNGVWPDDDETSSRLTPRLTEARPTDGYCVFLRFEDGVSAEVDLSYLLDYGGVFEPLRDPGFFRQLRVYPDGGTIFWPNEADIAPETLYSHAQRAGAAG